MKMHASLSLATTAAALLMTAAAHAAETRPIDERRPLKANAEVSVSNVAGSIEIEVWDKNELHLTGTLAPEVTELIVEGDAAHLRIEVKLPERRRTVGDTVLRLKVPAGVALEAESVSADVSVRGLKGAIEIATVSGDVTLDVASTGVRAQSVSGDVVVHAPAASVRAETVSGDVTVRGGKGEVHSESVSGQIDVQAREVRSLEAETVSGDMNFDLELTADAQVSVETLSGDVRLILPSLPDIDVDIHTFSGEIKSAFGAIADGPADRGNRHGDEDEDPDGGKHWRREGRGKGSLQLQSFSGDIVLRKR